MTPEEYAAKALGYDERYLTRLFTEAITAAETRARKAALEEAREATCSYCRYASDKSGNSPFMEPATYDGLQENWCHYTRGDVYDCRAGRINALLAGEGEGQT